MTENTVAAWTGHGRRLDPVDADGTTAQRLFERLASPEGLTARRSSFHRRDVVRAVADSFGPGADVDSVMALVDAFLTSDHVVALPVPDGSAEVLCRRDGTVVPLEADGARFSTPELLAVEERLIAGAVARQTEGVATVPLVDRSACARGAAGAERRAEDVGVDDLSKRPRRGRGRRRRRHRQDGSSERTLHFVGDLSNGRPDGGGPVSVSAAAGGVRSRT